jgi:hypothetical protein
MEADVIWMPTIHAKRVAENIPSTAWRRATLWPWPHVADHRAQEPEDPARVGDVIGYCLASFAPLARMLALVAVAVQIGLLISRR